MLTLLHIENVAVIERANIEFEPGMNVLTGETGAGKSIIIDAINAILGERVSKGLVRTGASGAHISAEFTGETVPAAWYEENDVEAEEGTLVLSRRISADGKSSCRVNGAPVSAAQLRSLGELLIDVHGQNDGRRLLSEANHRAYLDGFAELGEHLARYRADYAGYDALKKKLAELRRGEADKEYRCEELRKRIAEIEKAAVEEGEFETLSQRSAFLRNAGRISQSLDAAYYALYGGESSEGALALIMEAEGEVHAAGRYTERLEELSRDLNDLKYRAEDAAERLAAFRDELDFSPGELDRIESRLSLLTRLRRKYGDVAEMNETLEKARNDLEDLEYLTVNADKLEQELAARKKAVRAAAEELSALRRAAAEALQERIVRELSELNMPGVRFRVELLPVTNDDGFDAHGCDEVRFLMSANAGEELGRISRIASGGELSRIMLAMKTVLSDAEEVPTMIFDEIDTGVSGRAAQRVAEKLALLSRGRQVLCVTHLPQLAVMADAHYLVEKGSDGERTYTRVTRLEGEERLEEIARITGGTHVTEKLLESAAEQIAAAEEYKAGL